MFGVPPPERSSSHITLAHEVAEFQNPNSARGRTTSSAAASNAARSSRSSPQRRRPILCGEEGWGEQPLPFPSLAPVPNLPPSPWAQPASIGAGRGDGCRAYRDWLAGNGDVPANCIVVISGPPIVAGRSYSHGAHHDRSPHPVPQPVRRHHSFRVQGLGCEPRRRLRAVTPIPDMST